MKFLKVLSLAFFCILTILLLACDFSTSEEIAEKEDRVSCSKATVCPDTLEAGTICDVRDGQIYKTVEIGSQVWIAENMNYCEDNTWCYNDSASNCDVFGRLYEWEAAVKACPEGFHLPSRDEWDSLAAYAQAQTGDENNSLRSVDTWDSPLVTPGDDVFGFNALASGRYYFRAFADRGVKAYFWTSDAENSGTAFIRSLSGMINTMGFGNSFKDNGLSVRCVQDR